MEFLWFFLGCRFCMVLLGRAWEGMEGGFGGLGLELLMSAV